MRYVQEMNNGKLQVHTLIPLHRVVTDIAFCFDTAHTLVIYSSSYFFLYFSDRWSFIFAVYMYVSSTTET